MGVAGPAEAREIGGGWDRGTRTFAAGQRGKGRGDWVALRSDHRHGTVSTGGWLSRSSTEHRAQSTGTGQVAPAFDLTSKVAEV